MRPRGQLRRVRHARIDRVRNTALFHREPQLHVGVGRLAGLGCQTTSTLLTALVREGLIERRAWGWFQLRAPEALRIRAER